MGASRQQRKQIAAALELRRQLTADYSRGLLSKRDLLKLGLLAGGSIALPRNNSFAAALAPQALLEAELSPPT